jgi:RHS repeat-associated protein
VRGEHESHPYGSREYYSDYTQEYTFDRVGNMTAKNSSEYVDRPNRVGDNLNYALDYEYYAGTHRAKRIGTKYNSEGNENTGAEKERIYYYHGDHLGSAQVVTNHAGQLYERLEYTPYGETWIEWRNAGVQQGETTPYRFTGKERDEETGLYYYGARYLDPKTSRWLSADPAMGEYLPSAPISDKARQRNGNLPGMGGVFNLVNLHMYHYAGNNPVKYVDPDGRDIDWVQGKDVSDVDYARIQKEAEELMNSDTEAGRRYKELYDNPDVLVTITVTNEGGSEAEAKSYDDAGNGVGSDTDVRIDINQKGRYGLFGARLDTRATLAHEVSGHAYNNYKGESFLYKYGNKYGGYGKVAEEVYASGVENEYRAFLGLRQRRIYEFEGNTVEVPKYNKKTGSWSRDGRPWGLRY